LSMAALPRCTLRRTWKQGVQAPRVDRPVYPRHAELITHAKEGNRQPAEACAVRNRSVTRVRPPPA
jgi:hypothetical protein